MPDKENLQPEENDVLKEDLEDLSRLDGALPEEEAAEEGPEGSGEETAVSPEDLEEAAENEEACGGEAEAEEDTEGGEETAADPETVQAEELPSDEKEKKGFFSRKKDKKAAEYEEKIAGLTDRYQRLMAEFDNFRKRTDKEKSSMYDNGVMNTINKILPVVDNFERGLASVPEDARDDQVYKGMDQIYKQLDKVLKDMGVEAMECTGKPFDLNLHNAVMQVPTEDETLSGTVSQELQKGYTYKGTVLRHAMVSVFE